VPGIGEEAAAGGPVEEEADIEDVVERRPTITRGSENQLIEIRLKRHEPVEKGLRRLKKLMLREGVFQELRKRRHYEKPSVTLRRKRKAARFEAMLKQRHADD
jgi:small subunit ribosomal protein S21